MRWNRRGPGHPRARRFDPRRTLFHRPDLFEAFREAHEKPRAALVAGYDAANPDSARLDSTAWWSW